MSGSAQRTGSVIMSKNSNSLHFTVYATCMPSSHFAALAYSQLMTIAVEHSLLIAVLQIVNYSNPTLHMLFPPHSVSLIVFSQATYR